MLYILKIVFGDDKAARSDALNLMSWASQQLWMEGGIITLAGCKVQVSSRDQEVTAMVLTHLLKSYTPREGFKASFTVQVSA